MKLNQLAAWAGILALLMSILGYIVRVETQFTRYDSAFNVEERVSNIEKMLFPVLVELEVRKRIGDTYGPPPVPVAPPSCDEHLNVEQIEDEIEMRIQEVNPSFKRGT